MVFVQLRLLCGEMRLNNNEFGGVSQFLLSSLLVVEILVFADVEFLPRCLILHFFMSRYLQGGLVLCIISYVEANKQNQTEN